ncbi:MAG: aldo/keto reductase [Deltaproteobacteria bacterium]|nr:aldo/keto reductase [Deltaproteobacteria bacterium]
MSWPVRLALFGATLAIGYFVVAPKAIGMLEGVRDGFAPAVPAAITMLAVGLVAFVAGFVRLRRPVCTRCGAVAPSWLFVPVSPVSRVSRVSRPGPQATDEAPGDGAPVQIRANEPDPLNRRGFLAAAGAVGASGVAMAAAEVGGFLGGQRRWIPVAQGIFAADVEKTAPVQRPEWANARVQSYRRLGRTNAMVSDISLGSGRIKDKGVAIKAIDRGVNYFDTAPDYSDTSSERILGEAMRETGGRDKMFLATKFCTAKGHLPTDTPVPEIIAAVEGSLQRLQTDYVDLVHIHSCDVVERLMAPNFHEAFDRLREQGKAKYLGVSTHTPDLETVARTAIDSDRFDVLMLAYHHGLFPGVAQVIDDAHGRDIGVVAMKTLKGAKVAQLTGFDDDQASYAQAAFRWVLANPSVSCLVVSFFDDQHCDEYLYASGQKPLETDQALLQRYDRLASADYCRPHCGACLGSCERGLPIDTVLRYDMYFESYAGRKEMAREKYAKLTRASLDASGCEACPAPCAGACPFELPIRAKMVRAHERLRAV